MIRTVCFSIITLLSFSTSAQKCFDFHKMHCIPVQSKFNYLVNDASVSYLFKSGETRHIPFRLDEGKDYRLTVCTDNIFSGVVAFSIISENDKFLFDNSKLNYKLDLEFMCQKTQDVDFVITAPKAAVGISDTVVVEGCIGLLIEEMVSIKTGF
jgi:hypothetical protein